MPNSKKSSRRRPSQSGPSQEERRRISANQPIGGEGPPKGYGSRRSSVDNSSSNRLARNFGYGLIIIVLVALIVPLLLSTCTTQTAYGAEYAPPAKITNTAQLSEPAQPSTTSNSVARSRLKRDEAETPPTVTLPGPTAPLPADKVYVGETGHYLAGAFLKFWRANGSAVKLGNPLSEEFSQNGLTVQIFEKAILELHPEAQGTPQEVQLGLIGRQLAEAKGLTFAPASDTTSTATRSYFKESQHSINGGFKNFWESNNGLQVLGFPIGEEMSEQGLTVQYFERGRLEFLDKVVPIQLSAVGDMLLEAKGWPRPMKLPLDLNIGDNEIYQGRTLSIRLNNGGMWTPANVSGKMGETDLRFSQVGTAFKTFSPFAPQTKPGDYNLQVNFTDPANRLRTISKPITVVKYDFPVQYLYIPADKANTLDPLEEDKEGQILAPIYQTYSPKPLWTGLWGLPSPNAVPSSITTDFGERRSYNDAPINPDYYHGGIDYAEATGTPVFAPASGKVIYTGELVVRGNTVIVDHGMGVLSLYFHLSAITVKSGQEIKAGDVLGRVGNTGRSSGPHLHWEVRINGIITNPTLLQKQDLSK